MCPQATCFSSFFNVQANRADIRAHLNNQSRSTYRSLHHLHIIHSYTQYIFRSSYHFFKRLSAGLTMFFPTLLKLSSSCVLLPASATSALVIETDNALPKLDISPRLVVSPQITYPTSETVWYRARSANASW
jgi:hypothetical protein